MADFRERFRWWAADWSNRMFYRQCWSDLVTWAMHDRDDKGWGWRASLPLRPLTETCFADAERAGRCYCGKVGSDRTVLRPGEQVCPTPMPGRESRRLCSRPNGHEGSHRCGAIEWGRV